ncbi:hypothetical protein, variant 3 [Phytophthora nicotianae]|uniref:Hpc2-related domain-containing protein n=1 Tax=Phytophthora nicotianae TaxID=4792 RepID=W2N2D2_PHYNI|nr:hypothetical protein, variant 2 [Phytophthora nicotianae]ETM42818.1 hypothetical protein, variant 3 [Phytophthora nicotianae]
MTDWYVENLYLLATVLGCSPVVFVLAFIVISTRVRRKFIGEAAKTRKTSDTPEVALIKAHTRMVRLLSVVGILLQAVLIVSTTRLSSTSSTYSLALMRPVVNLCVFILGFMTNTHAAFRLAYMLLLGQIVVFDTIAEVSFAMVINCMEMEGMQCGGSALSLSLSSLEFLKRRELASLFLAPWVALETAYLCVAIGFCSSRYSARKLSLSRPTFNLRAALLAHFPSTPTSPQLTNALASLSSNMATSAPPQVSAPAAPKPRRTFHIQLDNSSPAEINFKQLVIESERGSTPLTPGASPSNTASNSVPATGKPAPAPRPQRFNIIEHLEKRYGGGAVLNDGDDGDVGIGGLDRRDDDDLYDSEDSFIDDTELQQNIEEVRGQTRVKTKHSGFFVNAGDEIETLEKEEDELSDGKSRRGKKRAVDGALRSFLAEMPDAASDWQPNEEVVRKLEVLRTAVQELAETAPIPKVFPRSLDEPLRAVDKLVVEAHPNKWRVTGYFATLMTFLPYTKQYLKVWMWFIV